MTIQSFRDLIAWQRSIELAEEIYGLTKRFPKEERYNLSNQLQRAVVSIPSNIAEGHERTSTATYLNFLTIALGSVAEVETQMEIAVRLSYLTRRDIQNALGKCVEIRKMLIAIRNKLSPTC